MNVALAAEDPGVKRILQGLLERYLASGDHARPLRLDERRVPQFSRSARPGEADGTWEALKAFESAGLVAIDPVRHRPGRAAYELAPLVRLVPGQAAAVACLIGFAIDKDPWLQAWIEACETATWLPESARALLATRPHRIGTRAPLEVLEAWRRVVSRDEPVAYVREASAKAFWGVSKALDERVELANLLRRAFGLPALLESPLQLIVHACGGSEGSGVLFIENQASFEAAKVGAFAPAARFDLVFSAGFRASASRLRHAATASVYPSDSSNQVHVARFKAWLFSSRTDIPTYFWGDLDFAGLTILKGLRSVFPGMRAWADGYDPLVALLRQGKGHALIDDPRKGDQKKPGHIGCAYADTVLMPAIEETGLFHDQEGL